MSPKEAFKFVTAEFQLDSYQAWIEAARVFKFSPDNIRVMTVQNTMMVRSCCSLPLWLIYDMRVPMLRSPITSYFIQLVLL